MRWGSTSMERAWNGAGLRRSSPGAPGHVGSSYRPVAFAGPERPRQRREASRRRTGWYAGQHPSGCARPMFRPCLAALLPGATLLAQAILPPPPVPPGNPTTPDKVLLGKALFWDEQLSSSRSVACGTCHVPEAGGADPRTAMSLHPGADGLFGTDDDVHGSPGVARHLANGQLVASPLFGVQRQVTNRRAPSVVNAAYAAKLFVDGRADGVFRDPVSSAVVLPSGGALESQMAGPPVSTTEMAHLGRTWFDIANELPSLVPLQLATQVPAALQQFLANDTYDAVFARVFGSPGVTPVRIIFAIAAYERSLISD